MIVRMKKITLLCLEADRDRTLEVLRDAEVLHLTHVVPPEGESLDARRRELETARKAISFLDAQATPSPRMRPGVQAGLPEPGELAAEVLALASRRRELAERLAALARERQYAEPFGSFDPALIRRLAEAGVIVGFHRVRAGAVFTPPAGATATVIGTDSAGTLLAVASKTRPIPGGTEIPAPERPLETVEADVRETKQAAESARQRLADLGGERNGIAEHARSLEESIALLEARAGMGEEGRIAYLQGFCPTDRVRDIEAGALNSGWGLRVADPDPAERVPVLVKTPAWVRPIAPLFSLIKILPGYNEADVSASFLIFLSVFFAMIVGDAGYGLIFLSLTGMARLKLKRAPAAPFTLMAIFSLCTIAWGIVTGVYFGMTGIPAPLRSLRIDWLSDNRNIMSLCLLLGAIHLSVAHIWNAARVINTLQAVAQAGWLAIVWTMFFAGRVLLLNASFPAWFIPISVAGLIAVVVFMTPLARIKSEWINHAMLPLTLMSNFGDVLSYLRLFALGVASVQLAGAFNKIITESIGFSGPVSAFFAAALLAAGHLVNIVLSLMSVLVHGIRLNALEFSMHMGLEWSGSRYAPFARRPVGSPAQPNGG